MDLTLQIMAVSGKKYPKGIVFQVWLREQCPEPPSPTSIFYFIHVTGVPFGSLEKYRDVLWFDRINKDIKLQEFQINENLINLYDYWFIDIDKLPPPFNIELAESRETTMSFPQLQQELKRWKNHGVKIKTEDFN